MATSDETVAELLKLAQRSVELSREMNDKLERLVKAMEAVAAKLGGGGGLLKGMFSR